MEAVLSSTSLIIRSTDELGGKACLLDGDCIVDGKIEREDVLVGGGRPVVFDGVGVISPTARRESKRLFVPEEVSPGLAINWGVGVAV